MKEDIKNIKSFFWLNIVSMAIVISAYYFKNEYRVVELVFNISLGFFCSGLVAFFVALINARSKNEAILEDLLFYSKLLKSEYNLLLYLDKEQFPATATKITNIFRDFYAKYKVLDFSWFVNLRYKQKIVLLFGNLKDFVVPFLRVINNENLQTFSDNDINRSYQEATHQPNIAFYKFISAYKELYEIVDRDLLNEVLKWDDNEIYDFSNISVKKHKTINEIIEYFESKK